MYNAKTIKLIGTLNFELALIKINDGDYHIRYVNNRNNAIRFSEAIKDLSVASMLYDMKYKELEAGQDGALGMGF